MSIEQTTDLRRRSNLTQGQLLIWTGQQLHPVVPLYNMAFVFVIDGRIEADLFARAFDLLVEQCDALRTVLETVDGMPYQRVLRAIDYRLSLVDLSHERYPQKAAEQLAQSRCELPFVLDQRLFDTLLIKLAEDKFAWYFNQHHVVCDAWSIALLFEHLNKNYECLANGTDPHAMPPLPAYASYLAYERDFRNQASAANYWKQMRLRAPAPAPLYGKLVTGLSTRSQRVSCDLGVVRSRRLRDLARHPDARTLSTDLSLFSLIATLMFAYLYRVSGQKNLAIGAPAHNRPTPDFKKTVGLFTEVYPLHVEIEESDSFLTLFKRVVTRTTAFLRYAMPGTSDPRNNLGCTTVVNFIHASFGSFAGASVSTQWLHPGHKDREHALRLQVHDFGDNGCFLLYFDFNCDVFDSRLREAAVAQFVRLLDGMLDDRHQAIDRVNLLSAAERYRQIIALNPLPTRRPHTETVVQRFAAQAETNPDAIALVCGNHRISYGALNRLADRLARSLMSRDTDGKQVVAISMQRSIESVVAILGVLKAGKAYVPIDPTWPQDRIAQILGDADVDIVLVQTPAPTNLPASVICVEVQCHDSPPSAQDSVSTTPIDPDTLAYVMYTSGSTGKPKGVMIQHHALANYVAWASEYYCRGKRLSFPLFTPLSFDLTVTSIYVPLVSGGQIIIYPETAARVDLALLDVVDDNRVDIIKLTPSHLTLTQERDLRGLRIKQLIVGGENLTTDLARRTSAMFGGNITIHNEYGPTEATVGCIVHKYNAESDLGKSIPIGVSIDNMQAYVLDHHMNPVPVGVIGELYVGGIGLAMGYSNQPELTAERFVDNPFQTGTRLYRTGDLARLNSHGEFDFIGRADHQVKIRGARIELSEIEAVITEHPGVDACLVDVFKRSAANDQSDDVVYCMRCGLPSNYPETEFDADLICNQCRAFDTYRNRAQQYFRSMEDLQAIFTSQRQYKSSTYDCLALLSGGKDSTYMLCRLVDMGLKVLAFTLDNGYISEQAKANIKRVAQTLGVDHIFGSTPAMNQIFVDSLRRHANVCQGCFKTIYTLSVNLAKSKQIPFIVTGLSRGQFFETRLTEEIFTSQEFDVDRIDDAILQARRSYHRVNDAVKRLLDVEVFKDDRIFDEIRFIDFYRYCPVDLQEMLNYLDRRISWIRPTDTGRSTNCLINDVGIYVHKTQRGYHNYALPYSWDVRMGHKTREAAIAELSDDIDIENVQRILHELGYDNSPSSSALEKRLAAYYTGSPEVRSSELRRLVAKKLPEFMLPAHFVKLDAIPLTANGKLDRAALPVPDAERPEIEATFVAPRTEMEERLAEIWCEVLHIARVGVRDNFFDLGGDSIMAIQIVARARHYGLHLVPAQLVDNPTIAQLARTHTAVAHNDDIPRSTRSAMLTPAAHWFFEQRLSTPQHWNNALYVSAPVGVDERLLEQSLRDVIAYHDALRLRYTQETGGWQSTLCETVAPLTLRVIDTSKLKEQERQACMLATEAEMHAHIDLSEPRLIAAALFTEVASPSILLLVIHHLAVDAVSWSILLDDLATVYRQHNQGRHTVLPAPTTSIGHWVEALTQHAGSEALAKEFSYWRDVLEEPAVGIPASVDSTPPDTMAATESVRTTLNADSTIALLRQVPKAARVSVAELLITALSLTLSQWTKQQSVSIFLESHGRESVSEGVDVSRTIGWFTSIYPVALRVSPLDGLSETIRSVKEQLRRVPSRGMGYGLLRYLNPDLDGRRNLPLPDPGQVLFNYLGVSEQIVPKNGLFAIVRPLTLSRHPSSPRPYLIEINAMVADGQLQVEWSYSRLRQHRSEVQKNAERFMTTLDSLIGHCIQGKAQQIVASDFPLAKLDENKLKKLSSLLQKKQSSV